MKSFYVWVNENKSNDFSTSIVDIVNKFLINFKPSKGNEKKVADIKTSLNKLLGYQFVNTKITAIRSQKIIVYFQDIAKLDKNSKNYIMLIEKIHQVLMVINRIIGNENIKQVVDLIKLILNQISALYHQEIYLSKADEIETVISNLVYDFDLDKSILGQIRSAVESFRFNDDYQLFYNDIEREIENFLFLNEFDSIAKEGVLEILNKFYYVLGTSALSDIVSSIIYQIKRS